MPTIALSREISNVSAGDAFEATLEKLPDLGFIIWKTRPLAWLVIANRELPEGTVNATISFRPTAATLLSISLSCDTIDEGTLQVLGTDLGDELEALLD